MDALHQTATRLKKNAEYNLKEIIVFFCTFLAGLMIIVFACGAALGSTLNYYYLAASCIGLLVTGGISIKYVYSIRKRRKAYTDFIQSPAYIEAMHRIIDQHSAVAVV